MNMYPQALVESMMAIAEVKGTLAMMHKKVTEHLQGDEDRIFENMIGVLHNVQAKLMTVGIEVNEPEASNFRKVTLETGPTA